MYQPHNPMKRIPFLLIHLLIISTSTSSAQPREVESAALQVIRAFQNQDSTSLDALIHPETGLVIVYAPGIHSIYTRVSSIQEFTAQGLFFQMDSLPTPGRIQWESLPRYECITLSWDKLGLFCDTTLQDDLLVRIPRMIRIFDLGDISDAEIERMDQLSVISKRVIYAVDDEKKIVFYLAKINQRWYLTALDLIAGDCST